MDIDKREETLVRQVLKLHALPNRRSTKEGRATARFSTSSSVKRKMQDTSLLQYPFLTFNLTKFRNDDAECNKVELMGVYSGQVRIFNVSLMFVFNIAGGDVRPFRS